MKTSSFRTLALLGLIVGAAGASANIVVYDPDDITIPAGGQGYGYYIDLAKGLYSQDPNAGFVVAGDANIQAYRRTGTITSMLFAANNTHVGQDGWLGSSVVGPLSLDPGTVIGPGGAFTTSNGANSAGAYRQERTGYLGVRFLNSVTQQVDYGWMEFTTTTTSTPTYTAKLNRWAFDDTGASILSGQTQAVPEPATIAALGVGALALLRKRHR